MFTLDHAARLTQYRVGFWTRLIPATIVLRISRTIFATVEVGVGVRQQAVAASGASVDHQATNNARTETDRWR